MKKYILWIVKYAIPILGFGLAIWSAFFLGENRQLAYQVVSLTEISSIKSEHLPGLKISYSGDPIKQGGIVTLKLSNIGDSPIYPREFDGPIEISLGAKAHFIDSTIVSVSPENLTPNASISGGIIKIQPLLLNPHDEMTIQAIAKGELRNIRVAGRIGGIKEITNANESKKGFLEGLSWLLVLYGLLCLVAYSLLGPVVLGGKVTLKNRTVSPKGAILIVAIVMISGMGALVFFANMHELEFGWEVVLIYFWLIILSEFIAIPFRPKEKVDGNN